MDGMNWPPRKDPGYESTRVDQRETLLWALRTTLLFGTVLTFAALALAHLFPGSGAPWEGITAVL